MAENIPTQNETRTAYLSDLAAACRKAQEAFYAAVALANEGQQQGYLDAITSADLAGTLADVRTTDAKVAAEFVQAALTVLDQASISDPTSTRRQAIQRLARAHR